MTLEIQRVPGYEYIVGDLDAALERLEQMLGYTGCYTIAHHSDRRIYIYDNLANARLDVDGAYPDAMIRNATDDAMAEVDEVS